jgi:methylthioribose-1-phosphate isomerase
LLPHKFEIVELKTWEDTAFAIKDMVVRGAPLIGVTAAYGIFLAIKQYISSKVKQNFDEYLANAKQTLIQTRPTAVNLVWGINNICEKIAGIISVEEKLIKAKSVALEIEKNDIETCKKIGENGVKIIEEIAAKKKTTINIMTHCNAGWLATVDYGTALAPIYIAQAKGIDIHIWVSETRPRNQGASLTAFELSNMNIPHTLVVDNACGHLLQNGKVDLVIVGADRIASNGDTANKIGTYLKALAAKANNIPFYIAAPISTIDFNIKSGKEIVIEERDMNEVLYFPTSNMTERNREDFRVSAANTKAANYGFDVTPNEFITGFITEKCVTARISDIL